MNGQVFFANAKTINKMFHAISALKRDAQDKRCSKMCHEALKRHENSAESSNFELLMESQILRTAVLGGEMAGSVPVHGYRSNRPWLEERVGRASLSAAVFRRSADKEIGYDDRVNPLQPHGGSDTAGENWVTS